MLPLSHTEHLACTGLLLTQTAQHLKYTVLHPMNTELHPALLFWTARAALPSSPCPERVARTLTAPRKLQNKAP